MSGRRWHARSAGTFDFVRYLQPRFADAPALRARMKRKVLPSWMAWLDRNTDAQRSTARPLVSLATRLESAIPVSRRLTHFFTCIRPDAVIVSPLVDAASDQVDAVRAAQSLGIPAVAAIASWDNLTNKGQLRVRPDMVTVWNEEQKREAVTLHGIEPARVEVTGAQLFDRWFERRPSQSREAFCAMAGLPTDREIVSIPVHQCSLRRQRSKHRSRVVGLRHCERRAIRLSRMPPSDQAASFQCRRVAGHRLQRSRPGAVFPNRSLHPVCGFGAHEFLRLALLRLRDCWREYERDGRSGHPRQAGAVADDGATSRRPSKARCTFTICFLKMADSCVSLVPSTSTSRS
jgi:hypothetical protein